MVDIIINPLHTDDDVCSICLDNLNKEQIYKLPECGHKYHTNCIMHWVRAGHCKCPYCGNNGSNNEERWCQLSFNKDQYIMLRQFARRKDAPILLKKQVEQLRKLEQKQKDINKEYKKLLLKKGRFGDMKQIYAKILRTKYLNNKRIRKLKRTICTCNNIIPLILVKKIIID
jgi:hypothetical protein